MTLKEKWIFSWVLLFVGIFGCTHKVQIEPSDKPFIVNLNVKVDHEVRHKVETQNKDLLNLEEEVESKPKKARGGKKG